MDGVQGIQKTMLLYLLGVSLFFHRGVRVQVDGRRFLSIQEDLELENELKLLNKPFVKTIQIEEGGDIFDCVDIYKQPAFDHPLLKNHKIQMQPSSYPSNKLDKNTTGNALPIELPKLLCPPRTVPIRRITKEDLIRMKTHSKRQANHTKRNYFSKADYIHWHATLNTKEGSYYGTKAYLNVWSHEIYKEGWTSAQIFVRSGFSSPDNTLRNAVEAGWRIEPDLFGDSKTRFFIYWTGDGYVHTGCYNHLCPGFVQTSNIVGLGAPILPLSTYGGDQYEIRLTIYKDPQHPQWWLVYRDEPIGYWPNTLFKSLSSSASEVFWGGTAGNPSNPYLLSPPIGSGHFSGEGFGKAAYVHHIMLVDNNNHLYGPDIDDMYDSIGPGNPVLNNCYNMYDEGYLDPEKGFRLSYGGPGGCLPPR